MTTATAQVSDATTEATAPAYIPVVSRPHTILGVCEAIGEDFGFNPLYLRILFAAGLFWNAALVIAGYVALAGIVALSRWLAPVRAATPAPTAPTASNSDTEQLKLAA